VSFVAAHPLLDDNVWRPADMQTFRRGGNPPYPEEWFWEDPVFGENGPFTTQAEAEADCTSKHQERRDLEAFARLIEPAGWLDWDRTKDRYGFMTDNLYSSMRNARRVLAAWVEYQRCQASPPALGASPAERSVLPWDAPIPNPNRVTKP
jgi:hypothetical protein